jgi:2-hydroxycyclohexanecarboxyl-CoA dehydrogenase
MITAAGLDSFERFTDITIESWGRVLAINLTGTFHCLQAVVPDMVEARWGRMVTISSSSAQSGAVRMAHYVASKAGVIGLTKALALELAPQGITVNNIPPGMIDTPMLRRAEAAGDLANLAKLASRMIPVGRTGTAEEIAAACGFLCSDEAAFITGQVIGVNGGMVL